MHETISLIDAGQFKAAQAQIDRELGDSQLPPSKREELNFQRERMRRILLDFTLSADDVKARVRKQIPDLTDADRQGRCDALVEPLTTLPRSVLRRCGAASAAARARCR